MDVNGRFDPNVRINQNNTTPTMQEMMQIKNILKRMQEREFQQYRRDLVEFLDYRESIIERMRHRDRA